MHELKGHGPVEDQARFLLVVASTNQRAANANAFLGGDSRNRPGTLTHQAVQMQWSIVGRDSVVSVEMLRIVGHRRTHRGRGAALPIRVVHLQHEANGRPDAELGLSGAGLSRARFQVKESLASRQENRRRFRPL